jgi:hypothetical protein
VSSVAHRTTSALTGDRSECRHPRSLSASAMRPSGGRTAGSEATKARGQEAHDEVLAEGGVQQPAKYRYQPRVGAVVAQLQVRVIECLIDLVEIKTAPDRQGPPQGLPPSAARPQSSGGAPRRPSIHTAIGADPTVGITDSSTMIRSQESP